MTTVVERVVGDTAIITVRTFKDECRTTGTMDNWYHAILDIGGQLGPSSYIKVDNWYHQVFPEWTTGPMLF